jgi:hypothetical protein
VAVNLTSRAAVWPCEESSSAGNREKSSTTVMLNNDDRIRPVDASMNEELVNRTTKNTSTTTCGDSSFGIVTSVRASSGFERNPRGHEHRPGVKVIHDDGNQLPTTPRKRTITNVTKNRETSSQKTRPGKMLSDRSTANNCSIGSVHVPKIDVHDRNKLWNSGRDSWLNLPKDKKINTERRACLDYAKSRKRMQKKS